MDNVLWERTSIILEVGAFFLVTIDLYGKERLEALSKRLHVINEIRYFSGKSRSRIILGSITAVCFLILSQFFMPYYLYRYFDSLDREGIFFGAIAVILIFVVIAFCIRFLFHRSKKVNASNIERGTIIPDKSLALFDRAIQIKWYNGFYGFYFLYSK